MAIQSIFRGAGQMTADAAATIGDRLLDGVTRVSEHSQIVIGNAQITFGQGSDAAATGQDGVFVYLFTIFLLAVFVGYYVVWNVTPALHSPLMGVTNAISSVIIVGALIAAGPGDMSLSKVLGFVAIMLASVNIFGGFIVTQRMLQMFKKKK